MNDQITAIGLYADPISVKESQDWEKKVRDAVYRNSKEYREEQEARALLVQSALSQTSNEQPERTLAAKKMKKPSTEAIYPNKGLTPQDWTNILLAICVFLLFLLVILKR